MWIYGKKTGTHQVEKLEKSLKFHGVAQNILTISTLSIQSLYFSLPRFPLPPLLSASSAAPGQ